MAPLKQTFIETFHPYAVETRLISKLWQEVEFYYSTKKRHYHNLAHLENLLAQLTGVKNHVSDWDTVMFSLYYHDIVYNALSKDNEEKSAAFAENRLAQANVPADKIAKCKAQILATKLHAASADMDTNLFTDADLSILGQPPAAYKTYCSQIRKEYSVYPDIIYNPGRKKVLSYFLNMESIFKTGVFYNMFEQQAKENMDEEMKTL